MTATLTRITKYGKEVIFAQDVSSFDSAFDLLMTYCICNRKDDSLIDDKYKNMSEKVRKSMVETLKLYGYLAETFLPKGYSIQLDVFQ